MNSKLFVNHKYGNWHEYLKSTNSLPLKTVIDNEEFTMGSSAVIIQPLKLDDKEFQLPKNVKTAKQTY